MIIITEACGQTCNQLFLFAHWLAYCAEHSRGLWFPGFHEHVPAFPALANVKTARRLGIFCVNSAFHFDVFVDRFVRRFLLKDSKLLLILEVLTRRSFRHFDSANEFLQSAPALTPKLPQPLCFYQGWYFRAPVLLAKHADLIRRVFSPTPGVTNRNREFLDHHLAKTRIGVHIRRGDYATAAPQHFYSVEQYVGWMSDLRRQAGSNVEFIVVSNERLPDFRQPWIHGSNGDVLEDLYLLAECDLIIGPPSTFNRWAAFYGNKPHLTLWDASQSVRLEDFRKFEMLTGNSLGYNQSELNTLNYCCIV